MDNNELLMSILEKLNALSERVAALERERVQHLAKITQARLEMLGLCSSDKAEGLQTYMKRFTPIDGARP